MMKLSLMQAVVATVSEQWESPLADNLLQHWEHDAGHAKFWRSSANFVFFFKESGRDYVLRFNHASERTAEVIQAEIDYVNALTESGIRVAKPVRSRTGNYVERIATDQGIFYAVVFEALLGKHIDMEELTTAQLVCWGKALGEFHQAATHYTQPGRPTWQDHLAFIAETLPAEETAAWQTLAWLQQQLSEFPIDAQNFGLIHFDFELDNLIWDGDQAGLIDFDDSAWYWFAADFAFALRDLFGDSAAKVDLQHEIFLHFVEGYRLAKPINQAELARIPLFLRLHNLFALARLYRALTPVNPAGELPWMAGLRSKLAAKMQFYRAEFSR